ncbi:MAG: NEW3 domain-containing protein, partial [Promicromonosporaceae bacterium]|nr:NEW3 domain-containing protein [Promicromonosporaceae bacterium]
MAVFATFALAFIALQVPIGPADADATMPFAAKFQANANGAIISIGNNLLSCGTAPECPTAQAGNGYDNNSENMVNLDADNDPSTFNSSASALNLPPGATVLWAGLYWGARLTAGTSGTAASPSNMNNVSFKAPGDAAYRSITASTAAHDQFGPNGASYMAYQRFADVTTIVQQAGNGYYWTGNVAAGTGQDRYAGWALTVAYSAPGLPLRNLTVFDGFQLVQQGSPQTVTVAGFLSPKSGAVDAQLTMVAYEGDLGISGDMTLLNKTQLATAISPGSNFFNSTNDYYGSSVTTRIPANQNMLGFDIKNLSVSGAIPNSATSATFTFSSSGDTYYPGVLGLAINLYAPDFTASSKAVTNLNGNSPARPGDILQYTLNYANTGQDPATNVVSTDVLPPGVTYVPGSLALVDFATGTVTPLTDAAGDDQGEYIAATRTIQVRLGAGANGTSGGVMDCTGTGCSGAPSSTQTYVFQVTVDEAASGTTINNLANLAYQTETTGTAAIYTTSPVSSKVTDSADVSITKFMSPNPAPVGAPVTATLTVANAGPDPAAGVVVTDQIPAGWNNVTASVSPTTAGACTIAAGLVTCNLGTLAASATPVVINLTGVTDSS